MGKLKSNFYIWMLIVVLTPFIIVMKLLNPPKPFVNPHLNAGPYVWPAGCVQNQYNRRDYISKKCADSKYYMGEGKEYGFEQENKGYARYYRVGNDAIDISCDIFDDNCIVHAKKNNVFQN